MRLLLVLVTSAALLTGCGGGGDEAPSGTGAPGSVGGTGEKVSGDDDGSGGIMLTTLAKQLASSLDQGTGFTIKDNTVRITLAKPFDEASAYGQCQIATTSRDGVGQTAPITLVYTDRELDCDAIGE